MATIHDLVEITSVSPHTTYSIADGNLLGVIDNVTSAALDDGEFDEGDDIFIGGVAYNIDRIQEPSSSGRFVLGDGSQRSFDPRAESNLDVVFLTVSNGGDIRHFIIPNDSYGDMNISWIRTGELTDVAGNDAAVISTANNDVRIVCFAGGTRIEVAGGAQVPVQDLRPGTLVRTIDNGLQPILWIGSQRVSKGAMRRKPGLRPVRIRKGALGGGRPESDLWLSQQHRVLVSSRIAQRLFGSRQVLVAAAHLCALDGIEISEMVGPMDYSHILLQNHELLVANGSPSESFYLGPQVFIALDRRALTEIARVSPDYAARPGLMPASRPLVGSRAGRKLADLHRKKSLPLVEPEGIPAGSRHPPPADRPGRHRCSCAGTDKRVLA